MFSRRKSFGFAFVFLFQTGKILKRLTLAVLLFGLLPISQISIFAVTYTPDSTFDSDGLVFTTFAPYKPDPANDIVVQPDGKIIVVGNGLDTGILLGRWVMARYNPNGSLDSTFGNGGKVITPIRNSYDRSNSVALLSDGKIIIAGEAMYNLGDEFDSDVVVARFNSNGTLDQSFGSSGITQTNVAGHNWVNDVTILPDNRIFLCGRVSNGGGASFGVLYTANGAVDTTFSGDGIIQPASALNLSSVAVQPDGKLLLAGQIANNWAVWRYDSDGMPDTTFDGDGRVTVTVGSSFSFATEMLVKPDGKILTVGTANNTNRDVTLVQFNPDGSLDTSFDGDGRVFTNIAVEDGKDVMLQPDGKILALGASTPVFQVMRYLPNGSLDTSFDGDGIVTTPVGTAVTASAFDLQPDGKIVATGASQQDGFGVIRFTPNGARLFDFEGDGKADISIFRPSNGQWWYLQSSTSANFTFQFGTSSDTLVPADYTGDGKTDIAFWRGGDWFVLRSEDYSYYAHPFGTGGDIPVPADYDLDGIADEAVFRPSTATWYIHRSAGGVTIEQFGQTGDTPVPADFDNDGRADIAIYRAAVGEWWINRSSGGVTALQFGTNTDNPVPGNYTGDGRADIAFYRPSTGEWFVLRSEDFSYYAFPFGTAGDVPVPADYDGDGKFDAAVFRPSDSVWYLLRTTSGFTAIAFGTTGDRPIPNAYVR